MDVTSADQIPGTLVEKFSSEPNQFAMATPREQEERECRPRGSVPQSANLKFVNVSHPSDKRSQTEIRRHVMRDVVRKRHTRARETRTEHPGLNIYNASDSQNRFGGAPIRMEVGRGNYSGLVRSLPPLGSFPVEAGMREMELVRFCKYQMHFIPQVFTALLMLNNISQRKQHLYAVSPSLV